MKTMKLIFTILLGFYVFNSLGQADQLKSTLEKLQPLMGKVKTGSKEFDQHLKGLEFGGVSYTYTETDLKGVSTTRGFEFNLSDIDPYTIRQVTQKDLILVSMTVSNKQRLIKVYKDGRPQSYDDQVEIVSKDIDHAREIIDLIKQSIPHAEKLVAGKLKLSGYEAMLNWLTSNIKVIELGDKTLKQVLTRGDFVGSIRLKVSEVDNKGTQEEIYTLNLADINLNSISFKVTGNVFALKIESDQQLKSISVERDGKRQSYTDDFSIATNNVDEARDIKAVLAMIVPLAIEKVKLDNPKISSAADATSLVGKLVKDLKMDEKVMNQSMDGQCVTNYVSVKQVTNGTDKNTFTFNFMDLNPGKTKIEVSGDKMYLETMTLDNSVMHFRNDSFDGYEKEIKIYTEDIEVARRLKFAVDASVEKCKLLYKPPFGLTAAEAMAWLTSNIGAVTVDQNSVKQTFEQLQGDRKDKVKMTTVSVKGNSSAEEIVEFNFSDINPATVELSVKGKWLFVSFETNYKNKIINVYKDGKIQPYGNSVQVAIKDVETARGVIAAIKQCIEEYRSK